MVETAIVVTIVSAAALYWAMRLSPAIRQQVRHHLWNRVLAATGRPVPPVISEPSSRASSCGGCQGCNRMNGGCH